MQDMIHFLLAHWVLAVALLVFLVLVVVFEWREQGGSVRQVDPKKLIYMMNRERAVVVDVRAKDAFDGGHILGAVHMPLAELTESTSMVSVLKKAKDKPVVVACAAGLQASKAVKVLQEKGFTSLFSLQGGMQAWQRAALPTE